MKPFLITAHTALVLTTMVAGIAAQAAPAKDWSHHAGKVPFVVGYEAGVAEASEHGLPLMLWFTTTWCAPCRQLASQVFADVEVADALAGFVPVIVDGDVEEQAQATHGVDGYPDIRFLTADGAEVGRVAGVVSKERFLAVVEEAKHALDERLSVIHETPEQARGLLPGAAVPAVTLTTVDGQPFDLRAAVLAKPTVLVFYRGGWCPYCTRHLASLRTIEGDLEKLGYQMLAISPERPDDAARTASKSVLGFTLLSDPQLEAAKRFHLAFRLDDKTIEKYQLFGFDLAAHDWSLPVPAAFVIDGQGKVAVSHVDADYRHRIDAADLLAVAHEVLGSHDHADHDR